MSELSATTTGTENAGRPVVGIVMGSDSDWPVMGAAAEVLDEGDGGLDGVLVACPPK